MNWAKIGFDKTDEEILKLGVEKMNGNHFNVKDLTREYEKGKREGAIEELKIFQLMAKHFDSYCCADCARFKAIVRKEEKRLLELEAEGKQNGKKA